MHYNEIISVDDVCLALNQTHIRILFSNITLCLMKSSFRYFPTFWGLISALHYFNPRWVWFGGGYGCNFLRTPPFSKLSDPALGGNYNIKFLLFTDILRSEVSCLLLLKYSKIYSLLEREDEECNTGMITKCLRELGC